MDAGHEIESKTQQRIATVLGAAIAIGFFFVAMVYWTPGADGGDRNGYLLEGKLFASGRVSVKPDNPFEFLGSHWVETEEGKFLLKYPPGLPALYGVIYRVLGVRAGAYCANMISPICAAAALFGCFLLFRGIVGSFFAILGMLAVAVSPVTLVFAITPNSHAVSICAAVWGIFFLMRWMRESSVSSATIAGLLLGYAASVRYTESSLAIAILVAILFRTRNKPIKSALPLLIGWLIPLLAVAAFNLITLGRLTGYSMTGESTGFGLSFLIKHAPIMLIQLNTVGLYFFFPLAVVGLILMFRAERGAASIILAWTLPTILIYTAYYWAPQGYVLVYMRFVLPAIPGLALAAMWLMKKYLPATRGGAISAGVIAAIGILPAFWSATVFAEDVYRHRDACVIAGEHALSHIPKGSVVISGQRFITHIETIGDYHMYLFKAFDRQYILDLGKSDPDSPQQMQPRRVKEMALLANHSEAELTAMQRELIERAIAAKQRVFLVLPEGDAAYFKRAFLTDASWKTHVVDVWSEDETLMTPANNPVMAADASPSLASSIRFRTMEVVEIGL